MSIFDQLPKELYLEIFSYLTPKELQLNNLVSKKFYTMSSHSLLWKKHLLTNFGFATSKPIHEKSYYAKLAIGKKYLLTALCKRHLSKTHSGIIRDLRDILEESAIQESDYENLKSIATKYGKLDSFNNLTGQLSKTLKHLLSLEKNSLNQNSIELIIKASYPKETLTNDEILSLANLGFRYSSKEELAEFATTMLTLLTIIFENSSEYVFLLLERQPILSKVILSCGSLLNIAIRASQYENAKQLISLDADINSCSVLEVNTNQDKISIKIIATTAPTLIQRILRSLIISFPSIMLPEGVDPVAHIQFIHYLLEKEVIPTRIEVRDKEFISHIIDHKKKLKKNHPYYQQLSDLYDAIIATDNKNTLQQQDKTCVIS